ncbi:MAG: bacillithiol biosynthesis deacetylase BshB1 [Candidatus Hydrogenedentes bacterium]|nr:bacillithiol biosynthesis deacetylase BshB1 [Candidatus Hydrogenedentota bacterium]
MNASQQVDALCVGAHPDDVEVGIGGLVRKMVLAGYRVGILDLSRGEMASRGTVETRAAESAEAARILGVSRRENAGLPDGGLANSTEFQKTLIPILRSFRARVLFIPDAHDRHPDHGAAHDLVRDANYFAGLSMVEGGEPHRAAAVYCYRVYRDPDRPSMVIDVTETFDDKMGALRAYRTQFFNPEYAGTATYVSSEAFWTFIHTRALYWGNQIGVTYGEPLYTREPIRAALPPGLEGSP